MYADLILALRKHRMRAELHQPDQLVLRYAHGFSSPGWLTWHEGWFACTWGPTCYRLPPDTDLDLAVDLLWSPLWRRWQHGGELTPAFADAVVDTVLAGLRAA